MQNERSIRTPFRQVAERHWKLARHGVSGKHGKLPFRPEGTKETASICRQMISPHRFHRPFRTAAFLPRYQTLRVWLISGCAFGTSHVRLRLELFHGLDATPANRRVFGILADVHFPVPAALAFGTPLFDSRLGSQFNAGLTVEHNFRHIA